MPDIRMPDGTIMRNVPEGTPRAEVMRRYALATRKTSAAGAFGRGAADASSFGFADELGGYIRSLASPDSVDPGAMAREYGEARDDIRANMAADEAQHPYARFAGQAVGAVAVPGGTAGTGARIGTRMAVNAAQGAAYGFGSGDGSIDDRLASAGKGALAAAAGGEVGRGVAMGASRVLRPATSKAARVAHQAGLRLTPGQALGGAWKRLEDRAAGFPLTDAAINAARRRGIESYVAAETNRALTPLGVKVPRGVPAGQKAIGFAQDTVSNAYDNAMEELAAAPDEAFDGALTAIGNRAADLPASQRETFEFILSKRVRPMLEGGSVEGRNLQALKRELDAQINNFKGAKGADSLLAEPLMALRSEVMSLADRTAPAGAKAYRAANQAFANMVPINKASAMRPADGLFTPNQFLTQVRVADKSAGKKLTARGEARGQRLAKEAAQVLSPVVPDSGTAGRAAFGYMLANPQTIPFALTAGLPYAPGIAPLVQKGLIGRTPGMRRAGKRVAQIATPLGSGIGLLSAGLATD